MKQTRLTENNAWEAFEKASGKLRDAYKIERAKGCWIIRKLDKDVIAIGEAPWVVADSGEVTRVGYPLSLETVLAKIAHSVEND